jgi:hypothetical protein
MLVLCIISFFRVGFCFDSTLILLTLVVKLCMDIGARSEVCGVFFKVCLNSRGWFMLCLVYVSCLVFVLVLAAVKHTTVQVIRLPF